MAAGLMASTVQYKEELKSQLKINQRIRLKNMVLLVSLDLIVIK